MILFISSSKIGLVFILNFILDDFLCFVTTIILSVFELVFVESCIVCWVLFCFILKIPFPRKLANTSNLLP